MQKTGINSIKQLVNLSNMKNKINWSGLLYEVHYAIEIEITNDREDPNLTRMGIDKQITHGAQGHKAPVLCHNLTVSLQNRNISL